eukprot:g30386.t1
MSPLRSIVSLPGTPTYRLAKELQGGLKHLVDSSNHFIHSAQEFFNIVKDTRIDEDEIMVSLDVTALFTSINIPLAKETLASLLDRPGIQTLNITNTVSKDSTLKLLDLCLTTHLIFNSKIYRLIEEAVMQRLEWTALPTIQPKLKIHYVDDTIIIIKCSKLEKTHLHINNILTGIKFTREEENNNRLPFLDVMVECTANGELQTSVHRKATHTDQGKVLWECEETLGMEEEWTKEQSLQKVDKGEEGNERLVVASLWRSWKQRFNPLDAEAGGVVSEDRGTLH